MEMERLLEARDAEIVSLSEQLSQVRSRNGSLEDSVGGMRERVSRLESGLGVKEAEVEALSGKLGEKEDVIVSLSGENKEKSEEIKRLRLALGELEQRKESRLSAERAEKERLEALLESNQGEVLTLSDEAKTLRQRNGTLESAVGSLQEKLRSVESSLREKETELEALQRMYGGETDQTKVLREQRMEMNDQSSRLRQAVTELESQKSGWQKRERDLDRDMQKLSVSLEERSAALDSATAAMKLQGEKLLNLETFFKEKSEALSRCQHECSQLQDALTACQHELKNRQGETISEAQALKEKLLVAEFQLRDVASRLQNKNQELEQALKDLASKENQLACDSENARELHARIVNLESAVATSKGSIGALESRLKEKESELLVLNERLTAMEAVLNEKQQAIDDLVMAKKGSQTHLDGLKQTVLELEFKKEEWAKKEVALLKDVQDLALSLDEKSAAIDTIKLEAKDAAARCLAMATCLKNVEGSLNETTVELCSCKADREKVHDALVSCQNELNSVKAEKDRQADEFKERLSFFQRQLKETSDKLNVKSSEMMNVLKDLEGKEHQLDAVKQDAQQLRQKNSSLDFTVQSLQVKISTLTEELKSSEMEAQKLCNNLTTAETNLASSRELISKLQLKLDLCSQISEKMEGANARIKELEAVLSRIMAFAGANSDEKADVSEWAVQQLGLLEVSKAKAESALAERDQREREYKELLSGYEYQLKEVGGQLSEKAADLTRVLKELGNRESELSVVKDEAQQLRERNSSLEFTVQSLQLKITKLSEELKNNEANAEQRHRQLVAAEASLVASKEQVSSLQLKTELGNQISEKLERATAKIKELETLLAEVMLFAQDKDEKLDASEWAVKQLGIFEVSKLKANLAQAERERMQLMQRCADLEEVVKEREDELLDMESCVAQLKEEQADLETVKRNLKAVEEKYEVLKAEHDQVLESIDEYRVHLHVQLDESFNLEQVVQKLKKDLARSEKAALASDQKLKELQLELEKTQAGFKCLMRQMLSLHENLLVEGKALLEFGKKDVSPKSTLRTLKFNNTKVDEGGKENMPHGAAVTSSSIERLPLQVLKL